MNRKRWLALAGTLLIAVAAWSFFAARKNSLSQVLPDAPLPAGAPVAGLPAVERAVPVAAQGSAQQGDDPRTVNEYVQALRQLYEQRGFHALQFNAAQPSQAPAVPRGAEKLYWVIEAEGVQMIGAFGANANPHGNGSAGEAESYVTTVSARASGGSHWETQSVTADDTATAFDEAALAAPPVVDPAGVPKHPSLSGVVSLYDQGGSPAGLMAIYSSPVAADSLLRWYREQMAAQGWQFNADETTGAQLVAAGTLCFVRGEQLCLICINADDEAHNTSVIVSLRSLNA